MNLDFYEVTDNCRRNLNKYTLKAFSFIPKIDNSFILDMGCGTGVPTIALMEICNGHFYAVDSDNLCLLRLNEKVNALNYSDRIKIIHASVFDSNLFSKKFNIILAEGLLNVIGFEKGLDILMQYLSKDGYLIIHDELHTNTDVNTIFEQYNLELLNSIVLDDNVWWNDYYCCLEKSIKQMDNDLLFQKEIYEITEFKKNSKKFRSIYYVLQSRSRDI